MITHRSLAWATGEGYNELRKTRNSLVMLNARCLLVTCIDTRQIGYISLRFWKDCGEIYIER